jgi:hypothetical protein
LPYTFPQREMLARVPPVVPTPQRRAASARGDV